MTGGKKLGALDLEGLRFAVTEQGGQAAKRGLLYELCGSVQP